MEFRKCTGTDTLKVCGEVKAVNSFPSGKNKDPKFMCTECSLQHRRYKYARDKANKIEDKKLDQFINARWV